MNGKSEPGRAPIGILILVAALTILPTWAVFHYFGPSLALPALALGSIVVLLAALLVYATLMNVIGLSDRTQALGLPEGSVRAIIALALVGLFAILASSVMINETTGLHADTKNLTGLTRATVDKIRADNPSAKNIVEVPLPVVGQQEPRFDLSFTLPPVQRPPVDEFMKQMLTVVGTLMTAITAFYFGGRPATGGDQARAAPTLIEVDPAKLPPQTADFELKIVGANVNNIRTVRLVQGAARVDATAISSNDSQVRCTIPADSAFGAEGAWDITIADDTGRSAAKAGALTIVRPTG